MKKILKNYQITFHFSSREIVIIKKTQYCTKFPKIYSVFENVQIFGQDVS